MLISLGYLREPTYIETSLRRYINHLSVVCVTSKLKLNHDQNELRVEESELLSLAFPRALDRWLEFYRLLAESMIKNVGSVVEN